jgi:hypothetical protein
VETTGLPPFAAWESFYVIIGSSAAALTGLQFVVIVLGAERKALGADEGVTRAFATPTVVHFCAVLLVSAILSAPWPAVIGAAVALACCGGAGIAYVATVISQTRRQTTYQPVLEDWLWHSYFPLIAYATLLVAAVTLPSRPTPSLFAIGSASLLLLFAGIHNAWDAVTYIALSSHGTSDKQT